MKNPLKQQTLSFKLITDELNMDLSPTVIGYEVCNRYKPAIILNKPLFVFHLIVDGAGYVSYDDGKETILTAGDFFVISPTQRVTYRPDPDFPWTYFWIELTGELTNKIFRRINFPSPNQILHVEDYKEITTCFYKIFDNDQQETNMTAETLRITSELMKIFSYLLRNFERKSTVDGSLTSECNVKKIKEYIDNNFTNSNLTISKVASHFYFSPAYISRLFKEVMSISPIDYVIQLRMRRAVQLLAKESFSISQIAFAVGYKNQFYFSKQFSQYYGVPPSRYNQASDNKN